MDGGGLFPAIPARRAEWERFAYRRGPSTSASWVSASCSARLTVVPPTPRKPPSLDASDTFVATFVNHVLYAVASVGDFRSTAPTAVLSVPINASLVFDGSPVGTEGSSGRPPPALTLSASDFTTSGASPRADSAIALPTANAYFAIPTRLLVSDRATNIPAATGAPAIAFHSSGL